MTWTKKQIDQHVEAGKLLTKIKDEFYSLIRANKGYKISEKECIEFIKKAYKKHGLVNDSRKEFAIVAFDKNTNQVHHFPSPSKTFHLKPNTLILLDMWARLPQKDAPYADVTFMFYYGKTIPSGIKKTWDILIKSRNSAIEYIKQEVKKGEMPRGLDIDRVAYDIIGNAGLGQGIKHTIGHSLGFDSPHGKLPGINWREYAPLLKNIGYTIEPGIYLEDLPLHQFHSKSKLPRNKKVKNWCGGFGMRTEIDFYINNSNEVIITTPVQEYLEII